MKFLQKLGKALMLPVAVLPICGILMGIGYRLCPATMQGGDIQGAANLIGLFLVKAGGALIDNMAILFAIGVGVGMSEKNDGTGGIAALASWLMMKTLLAMFSFPPQPSRIFAAIAVKSSLASSTFFSASRSSSSSLPGVFKSNFLIAKRNTK